MGSPGTYGLSAQKAQKLREMMGGPSQGEQADPREASEMPRSARARRFFADMLADRDWSKLLTGREWRVAAGLITGEVSAARVMAGQARLEDWAEDRDLGGEMALIQLGNRLQESLDRDLPERELIPFDLASYALRRTLKEVYAPGSSPFDVTREQLLDKIPRVDARSALTTYISSYLQELVHHLVGGFPAAGTEGTQVPSSFLTTLEKGEAQRLAGEMLSSLEKFSERKHGPGRPLSEALDDLPGWLAKASQELFEGGSG